MPKVSFCLYLSLIFIPRLNLCAALIASDSLPFSHINTSVGFGTDVSLEDMIQCRCSTLSQSTSLFVLFFLMIYCVLSYFGVNVDPEQMVLIIS